MSRRIFALCLALFLTFASVTEAGHFYRPVVVAPAPAVSYYYAPAPVVSYYAPAPVAAYYYPSTVTSYRYGVFGLRRLDVVTPGATYVAPAPVVPVRSYYYAPPVVYYP